MLPVRESLFCMGWVEEREARDPRACWRVEGRVRRRTCATVEDCERVLREEEQCSYRPPAERRPGRPRGPREHEPSITQYSRHKCRGPACKKAWSDYQQAKREQKRALLLTSPETFKHGVWDTYCMGCSCGPCQEAGALYRRTTRERRQQLHAERHAEEYAARRRIKRASIPG